MNGMNTINSIFVFKDLEQEPLNEGPEITFYQVSSLELDQYQLKVCFVMIKSSYNYRIL